MINEILHFVKSASINPFMNPEISLDYKKNYIQDNYPKIFLIKTIWAESENKLQYNDFKILLSSETQKDLKKKEINTTKDNIDELIIDLNEFLNNNEKLVEILNMDGYITPIQDNNKAVGSTSGLLTYSLFHIKLTKTFFKVNKKKNEYNFYKKAKKTHYPEDFVNGEFIESNLDIKLREIFKEINKDNGIDLIYIKFFDVILELFKKYDFNNMTLVREYHKANRSEKRKKKFYELKRILSFVINTPVFFWIENLPSDFYRAIRKSYINYRIFNTNDTILEGTCPICKKETNIGLPAPFNNQNVTKPFLLHYDRPIILNTKVCAECALSLNDFEQYIKNHRKINPIPIFLDKNIQIDLVKYIQDNSRLRFFDLLEYVFNQGKLQSNSFILVHYAGKSGLDSFDYVSNYKYEFGKMFDYFGLKDDPHFNKRKLASFFAEKKLLKLNTTNIFATKIKNEDPKRSALIYKYRLKLFDWLYKNHFSLQFNEFNLLMIQLFEFVHWNVQKRDKDYLKINWKQKLVFRIFNIYLNSSLFYPDDNLPDFLIRADDQIMLDKLRENREKIVAEKIQFKISSENEFAYYLGQMVYYLIQQSETKRHTMGLLNPIISITTANQLKRILIEKYLEPYSHKLSTFHDFRHTIFTVVLDYIDQFNDSFQNIKIPFYIGFFDKNIFFESNKNE